MVGDHESGQGYPGVFTLALGSKASPIRWAKVSHPGLSIFNLLPQRQSYCR